MSELQGLRVLIVEDEGMIAMMAEDIIVSSGGVVAGLATTLAEGFDAAAGGGFDVAMLDVNLDGENSMPLAASLTVLGRPFIFTTGYGSDGVAPEHSRVPVLNKPYAMADLLAALQAAGTSSTTSMIDSKRG